MHFNRLGVECLKDPRSLFGNYRKITFSRPEDPPRIRSLASDWLDIRLISAIHKDYGQEIHLSTFTVF